MTRIADLAIGDKFRCRVTGRLWELSDILHGHARMAIALEPPPGQRDPKLTGALKGSRAVEKDERDYWNALVEVNHETQ